MKKNLFAKRVTPLVLSIALVLGCFSVAPRAYGTQSEAEWATGAGGFLDVPANAWYAPAVEAVQEAGWMMGISEDSFYPNDPMTRAMFTQVMWNMAGQPDYALPEKSTWFGFSDVAPDSWYRTQAEWCYAKGLLSGTGNNMLSPLDLVTREQLAKMMYRFALATGNSSTIPKFDFACPDFNTASSWAKEPLTWAIYHGIFKGDEQGLLRPKDTVTRAEMAQVLSNAMPVLVNTTVWDYARPSQNALDLGLTEGTYPRVDGSTSTLSLVQLAFEQLHDTWDESKYPAVASKTVPSYKKLIAGELDMIISPYPAQEILDLAKEQGVELEFHKLALEALVFITPLENTTENITGDQVRSIYADYDLKNWSALGGPDKELVPLCRNSDSGSQSQLDNLILQGKPIHPDIEKNFIQLTMPGMLYQTLYFHNAGADGKPRDCFALGYTLFSYLETHPDGDVVRDQLKMLSYEGVAPTAESIRDESYPLVDGYYAVLRKDSPDSARKLLSWLESPAYQSGMQGRGFLPAVA